MEKYIEKFLAIDIKIKIMILLLITGYAGYDSYNTFVIPAQNKLESAKSTAAQLDKDIEEAAAVGRSIPELEAKRQQAENELMSVFRIIPNSVEIDEILAGFTEIANNSSIILSEFIPNAGNKNQAPQIGENVPMESGGQQSALHLNQDISLKAKGTYKDLALFIDGVLSMPRVIRLKSFNFKSQIQLEAEISGVGGDLKTKTIDGEPILQAEIVFTAYYQKHSADSIDIITPIAKGNDPLESISEVENSFELGVFDNLGNFAEVPGTN